MWKKEVIESALTSTFVGLLDRVFFLKYELKLLLGSRLVILCLLSAGFDHPTTKAQLKGTVQQYDHAG
jgi:hypothetical protein